MLNILVIQLARIGDLIQSLPLLQALKSGSDIRLTLMVDSRLSSVQAQSIAVDEIIPLDLKELSRFFGENDIIGDFRRVKNKLNILKNAEYDIVYNLNHSVVNFAAITQLRWKRIKGFRPVSDIDNIKCSRPFRVLFNQSHNRCAARMHLADIFKMLGGKSIRMKFPLYKVTADGESFARNIKEGITREGYEKIITIHPGAGAEIRKWGAKNFANIAQSIINQPKNAVIIIGNDTDETTKVKRQLTSQKGIFDLTGKTDLDQLSGILKVSDLVISVDSGPLQLAAAVGTKTLGLYFISAFVFETGPLGDGHYVLQSLPECAPCDEEKPACTDLHCRNWITPQIVADISLKIINGEAIGEENIELGENLNLYRSTTDRWGQKYDHIQGNKQEDRYSFYRQLWFRILSADIPTGMDALKAQWLSSNNFEKRISRMGLNRSFIPLVYHYYLTRADEGSSAAMDEFIRALAIMEEIGIVEPFIENTIV